MSERFSTSRARAGGVHAIDAAGEARSQNAGEKWEPADAENRHQPREETAHVGHWYGVPVPGGRQRPD